MTQVNVWNTTVAGSSQYGMHLDGGAASLRNSIFYGSGTGTGWYRTAGTLTSSHNLVYGFATNFSGVTPDADTQVKNPRFVNAGAGDYRLLKGSPAINAGTDLLGLVDEDIQGNARPAYQRWEIGAHEYLTDDASLRILTWTEKK
jgi:hypothetical protein